MSNELTPDEIRDSENTGIEMSPMIKHAQSAHSRWCPCDCGANHGRRRPHSPECSYWSHEH